MLSTRTSLAVLLFAFAAGPVVLASWLSRGLDGASGEGVMVAGLLLLAALAAWMAARLALGPVKALLTAMQENREGSAGRRIFLPGHGEIELAVWALVTLTFVSWRARRFRETG